MIVAASTAERQAQERFAHRVDLVVDHVADHLFLVGVASIPAPVGQNVVAINPAG